MTSQPPLRVRISGTTVARRTKFGHNVHHTQAVVFSGSDLGLDPWGHPQAPRKGPIKEECVSESLQQCPVRCDNDFLAPRCENGSVILFFYFWT